ncbi:MAG: hypothetical protein U1F25_10690 [Rubrivivax sp.]
MAAADRGVGYTGAWHTTSEAYLTLPGEGRQYRPSRRGSIIALRDLDEALALDADGNGEITWGELRAAHAAIAAYAGARVKLAADGRACTASVSGGQGG